jgi:hypothetical protein
MEGRRKALVSFESAYVALSRMKQHAQVYTDNREVDHGGQPFSGEGQRT